MENDRQHRMIGILTTVSRFVLAVVFIFSGFVKAIDPLGTQYKIQDYIDAFGWAGVFPDFVPFLASALLGMLEFCLGVYLFFGIRRIIAPRAVVALMAVMTPLTFWLALDNPVSDCGCFGDAVVLSNWETFWKNVVLLAMSVVVLKWRKRLFPLVTTRFDWLIALYGFVYILCMTIYCYRELPVFDFRPYYVGADIRKGMEIPEGEELSKLETLFVMQKDGVKKEFTLDNYPDSTWTFVSTETVLKKDYVAPVTISFTGPDGEYADHLAAEGKVMIISVYNPDMRQGKWGRAAKLITDSRSAGITPVLLVASAPEETEEALRDITSQIVEAVHSVLEKTPPELAADIYRHGIYLTGGASQVNHLSELISKGTGLQVNMAEQPIASVAIGLSRIIKDDNYKSVAYAIEGMGR